MLSTGDGGPLTVDLRRPPAEGSIATADAFGALLLMFYSSSRQRASLLDELGLTSPDFLSGITSWDDLPGITS